MKKIKRYCHECGKYIFYFYKDKKGKMQIKTIVEWTAPKNHYICKDCFNK